MINSLYHQETIKKQFIIIWTDKFSMRRRPRVWKLGSLTEITEKLQMCGREQKSKKDQTSWLVHRAQCHSHWCEQLSQTENAHLTMPMSYKKIYCSLLVLHHSVRIFQITHWHLLQTGIPTNELCGCIIYATILIRDKL